MLGQLLAGLSVLVFVHELGHFLAARAFGIRVEKFYLFFDVGGFKLLHFRIGETEYGIGWLPLGGYCKISGMVDESLDREQLEKEPQTWEYRSKPAWQRFIVITAGVFMNLVVGILIFTALLFHQKSYLPTEEVNRNGGIYAYPLAREIGFRTGDQIIGPNGKSKKRFSDAIPESSLLGGDIRVLREGKPVDVTIPDNAYKQIAADTSGLPFFDIANFPTLVKETAENSPAQNSGILPGDRILAINGVPTPSFGKFKEDLLSHEGDTILLTVLRTDSLSGISDTLSVFTQTDKDGKIGILVSLPYRFKDYSFLTALRYGTFDAVDMLATNIKGLGKVLSGEEKASETISGPIGIASIYGPVWNWARFWYITGILSLVLAFMNILPIPGLDGGHMIFTLYEMITRRKVSDKVLESAQMVGMALLFALIIFVFANDILRLLR